MNSILAGFDTLPRAAGIRASGTVLGVNGPLITARLPFAAIGDVCEIDRAGNPLLARIVAFHEDVAHLAPLDSSEGLHSGARIENTGMPLVVKLPLPLEGRVLDAVGKELQGAKTTKAATDYAAVTIERPAPPPLDRPAIDTAMPTGLRALDAFCTVGRGQRLGLFAGAGVGKSTLLGMIARHAAVDVTVIGLIGERGREVGEFIEQVLGPDGLARAVVVVATSNESAARRAVAPLTATAIAEYFRDQGKNVLLLIDSLTRTARALREVGLAAGEVPVRQGYPPSVYSEMPRLLERAGNTGRGSITAIYTVLTNGEQESDALGDELKSLLDGHILLDPGLAERGVFPAIDLATSISRVHSRLHTRSELDDARVVRKAWSSLKRDKDILMFGGTPDPELRAALAIEDSLKAFLSQAPGDECHGDPSDAAAEIAATYRSALERARMG